LERKDDEQGKSMRNDNVGMDERVSLKTEHEHTGHKSNETGWGYVNEWRAFVVVP
jgi:hypothetical protein